MSESVSSNDELREMRAHQAALRDEFVTTNAIYQTLSERIHKIELSAVDCAKLYGEATTAMAADPSAESKLGEFVEVLSGSIVELASRIPYSEDGIRAKLVDFVAELQKVVVTDPKSLTGEQLRCYSDQKLWTDLPMYWTWCSEERVSFEPHDPTLTLHETQRWKNLSAFWADSLRFPELGQPRYGRSACSDAFGPYEPGEEVGNHTFLVQVACLWLIYSDGHMGAHMLGTSNHLDHKAWDKWKQGLQDFQDTDDEDETKALIDKALAEMEKAEQRWLS